MQAGVGAVRASCRGLTSMIRGTYLANGGRRVPSGASARSRIWGRRANSVFSARAIQICKYSTAVPESAQKFYLRADELFREAAPLIEGEKHRDAELVIDGAIQMRKKGHEQLVLLSDSSLAGEALEAEVSKRVNEDGIIAQYQLSAAYAKLGVDKYAEAELLYTTAIPALKASLGNEHRDVGLALLNQAEAIASQERFSDAEGIAKEATTILRKYHDKDEILGAALSNLCGYLSRQDKHSDARPYAVEALKIFTHQLGRQNEYTKSAFNNLYIILKELGRDEDIRDLETDWKTALDTEAPTPDKIPEQVLENLRAKFEARELASQSMEPAGVIKGVDLGKDELTQFADKWKEQGHSTEEPAFLDVLEQEIDALKSNKNRTEESLQAATEKLVKLTEDDSPEWRQMVEELVRAMPALEKTQEVLAGQRRARKAAETAKSKEPKKPLSEKLKDLDSYLEGAREIKKAHTARKLAAKKEAAKKAEDEKAAKAAAAAKAKADANKKK